MSGESNKKIEELTFPVVTASSTAATLNTKSPTAAAKTFMDGKQQLTPLPKLCTDAFESCHIPFRRYKTEKRTSVNVLKTLITHHEKLSMHTESFE